MNLSKQEDLEKRIQILRAKGFEISPAMAQVIKHEIDLALAERDREVVEKIREYAEPYENSKWLNTVDAQKIINLITNK